MKLTSGKQPNLAMQTTLPVQEVTWNYTIPLVYQMLRNKSHLLSAFNVNFFYVKKKKSLCIVVPSNLTI